ncbi:hypothetical protein BOW53_08115 [Solemya pervernicosa gill symbiont]|uniref:DUF2249 domain-containing protein n=2 Tax=Gammaproteobacteria incertae sedis TaxID=118884 RepID=A0A1T2L5F9_9GAMM|nr:hypothetical protein BOW53_08115 [Solemya pervernicosa gill symbiont]
MEPPEPLVLTLAAAESLATGDYLHMIHRRFPCLLFDNLDQRRCGYLKREAASGRFDVYIWSLDDPDAEMQARQAAEQLSA